MVKRMPRWCMALVPFATALWLGATLFSAGWTWDESYYFPSAMRQVAWLADSWQALCAGGFDLLLETRRLDAAWHYDTGRNPHPSLYKTLGSMSWALLHGRLGDVVAYRAANAFMAVMLVWLVCWATQRGWGWCAGSVAGISLVCMPRFFGHAHIAATEIPVAVLWFAACIALWRARCSWRWTALLAIVLGAGLATKFTAVLIPPPLVAWALICRDRRALRALAIALCAAPIIALALHPGWWPDPVGRVSAFVTASLARDISIPIPTMFLGTVYAFSPPWYYAPLMCLVTIPVAVLVLCGAGAIGVWKAGRRQAYASLYASNIVWMLAVTMLPGTPVHDGVRQFFPVLPFLAVLAGIGAHGR